MLGQILAHSVIVHLMTSTTNDTLAAGTDLPASGSYVDVSPYERFHVWLWWGGINASDTPALTVKCADSVSGTLDVINATLAHTAAADDDDEFVTWTIEVSSLPTDHHFIAIDVTGGVTNATLAAAFLLGEVKSLPATQVTAVLPAASQYYYAGGVVVAET